MKKLLSLLTLLLCVCSGAWAATVADLVAISSNYTFIADNITSNGTVKLTANTLYENGYIFAPTGNTVATNKGKSTIDGVEHLNSLRLKNTQDQLCFKVAGKCTVTFYTQSHDSRGIQVGSAAGGTQFGSQTASTKEWSVEIKEGGTVYLSSYGGDFYFAGFKVTFPKPDITTQPVSATYQTGETPAALTVSATASAGSLSYKWYSCEDESKTNAVEIDGETSDTYTPSTATAGTFYYFCRVTDDNGSADSEVATIIVSAATAPTISVTPATSTVSQGTDVTFTATATGVPVPTIQWYSCDDTNKTNAVAIDGATDETYAPSTATVGSFYYYAVATNASGSAASDVVSLTVNPLYTVTYANADGAIGEVPEAVTGLDGTTAITLPKNFTMYKAGYTMTGWSDGENTFALGTSYTPTANVTLTAVFTENTVTLNDRVNAVEINFDFRRDKGAPIVKWQYTNGHVWVAQASVDGKTIDVPMTIDTESGKFNNSGNSDCTQTNGGTVFTIPSTKGAKVEMECHGSFNISSTTIDGSTEYTGKGTTKISYNVTNTADNITIVIGDGSYYKYCKVTLPAKAVKIYDFANSLGTGVAGSDNVSSTTQKINGTTVNVIKMSSSLGNNNTNYWKITPIGGTFKKGDVISWTGCYDNSSTKTTTIAIYDNSEISTAIVTGEVFPNVNGGTAASPKPLITGYYTLAADADALYIGRSGGTATYLTALTVLRQQETTTISASGYNTFSSPCALDLSTINGGMAYVASSVTNGNVILTKCPDIVPAGTGLFIAGTAGDECTIGVSLEDATFTGTNLFVGMPNGGEVEVATEGFNYVFGWTDTANPGFYKVVSDKPTLKAGKAYLHTTTALGADAARLGLSFGEEATGINNVNVNENDNRFYDLMGRRVAQPQQGLYIVNGKKVIIK